MKKTLLTISMGLAFMPGLLFASSPQTAALSSNQPKSFLVSNNALLGLAGLTGLGLGIYYYEEIWKPQKKIEKTEKVVAKILHKFDASGIGKQNLDHKHSHEKLLQEEAAELRQAIKGSYAEDELIGLENNIKSEPFNTVFERVAKDNATTNDVPMLVEASKRMSKPLPRFKERIEKSKENFWTSIKWFSGIGTVLGVGYFFSRK